MSSNPNSYFGSSFFPSEFPQPCGGVFGEDSSIEELLDAMCNEDNPATSRLGDIAVAALFSEHLSAILRSSYYAETCSLKPPFKAVGEKIFVVQLWNKESGKFFTTPKTREGIADFKLDHELKEKLILQIKKVTCIGIGESSRPKAAPLWKLGSSAENGSSANRVELATV